MNNDIIERIKYIQRRKEEIDIIDKKINEERIVFEKQVAQERKKFEETLSPLKEYLNRLSKAFDALGKNIVSIRLGDLVEELAYLIDTDVSNIGVEIKSNVKFCGKTSLDTMSELFSNKKMQSYWDVLLIDESRDYPSFCYQMNFKLDLNEEQADGKTFLEHCSNEIMYDSYLNKCFTILCIGKNRDDIILNIPLNSLFNSLCTEKWYPNDLIIKAIVNCLERDNIKEFYKSTSGTRRLVKEAVSSYY